MVICPFGRNVASPPPARIDHLRAGASDHDMRDLITSVWSQRIDRYSEERTELARFQNQSRKVEMYQIGG